RQVLQMTVITRRAFIETVAAVPFVRAGSQRAGLQERTPALQQERTPALQQDRRPELQQERRPELQLRRDVVDPPKLRERFEPLSQPARPAGGTCADGVSRVAYSDADVAGRKYVMALMRAAGLEPRIDPAGNIFARREGREPALPPILFGSHIDSVP